MNHEVLMVPDPQKTFIVTTDTSQYDIGAMLDQQDGKKLRLIEYMCKKMPSKKLAKSTYERELYALYKALVHWRHFLLGRFFYLRTDHQTLKWIKTQPALSDALKRWIKVIDQYDLKLEYLKGEYNKVADALSRRANYLGALVSEFGVSEEVNQSLVGTYQEDPVTMDIIRKLQAKDKATEDEFVMVDGLLFLDKAKFKRLVIPSRERLRSLFLGKCHDAIGHFGYKTTSANLIQRFWWPGTLDDAKKYVETCQVRQRDKPRTQAPLGLLKPLPIPTGPGQSVSMDFMDTLVTSRSGKRNIFVIIDRFTKYARLIAMSETTRTEHVIKLFMDNWAQTLEEFVRSVYNRWHDPQGARKATDAINNLCARRFKDVRELTDTVERLLVVPGVRFDQQVLLTDYLRCLPAEVRTKLVDEAYVEQHTFASFSKNALDIEAKLGSAHKASHDGRKRLPQDWKKKGQLMFVDHDGHTTEIDDFPDLGELTEQDGASETSDGGVVAPIKEKARGTGKKKVGRSTGQGDQGTPAWVKLGLDYEVWRDRVARGTCMNSGNYGHTSKTCRGKKVTTKVASPTVVGLSSNPGSASASSSQGNTSGQ
ncbi:hypothetical protein CBR_g3939 [Chara braunii]|uniref:Integrase catalytic domain-containing protein n=1 Tax=Chara braunii TaxID=69332 RepID=A0A388KGP9_CHABU|nr:hypothetical protein CBR_g3939 [Chara braunii]|eukprot:GBG69240.1 hypothetical protein CBR_g3939 [Chara braunii]